MGQFDSMKVIRKIKRLIERIILKHSSPQRRANIMRKYCYHIGENVRLWTYYFGTEPYLIDIHDNVCIAANVHFITHDVSAITVKQYLGLPEDYVIDKVNCISLCSNCMIGAHSILMPGVRIGQNSIVASGSIVTKNIPDNEVWGGYQPPLL